MAGKSIWGFEIDINFHRRVRGLDELIEFTLRKDGTH